MPSYKTDLYAGFSSDSSDDSGSFDELFLLTSRALTKTDMARERISKVIKSVDDGNMRLEKMHRRELERQASLRAFRELSSH